MKYRLFRALIWAMFLCSVSLFLFGLGMWAFAPAGYGPVSLPDVLFTLVPLSLSFLLVRKAR